MEETKYKNRLIKTSSTIFCQNLSSFATKNTQYNHCNSSLHNVWFDTNNILGNNDYGDYTK